MSYNKNTFAPIGGQSARGASPQLFSYLTTDTKADTLVDGYFNGARTYFEAKDLIQVTASDGYILLQISLVPLNGDITTEDVTRVAVPDVDTSDNTYMSDVVGNKDDTVAGDSLVSLNKQTQADIDTAHTATDAKIDVVEGKIDIIDAETDKIDQAVTDGLAGVNNSLSYRVEEIEKHLHNCEKWFGLAAIADAELHVADRMAGGVAPFVLTSGADTFGTWVQILGSEDTPVVAGQVKFDPHRFAVVDTNSLVPYIIQLVEGESADIAAKIAAEDFCEFPYKSPTNNADSGVEDVLHGRMSVGVKLWARCAAIGDTGKTISFYYGMHEYKG